MRVIDEFLQHVGGLERFMLEELKKLITSPKFHGVIVYQELPVADGGRIDVDIFNRVVFEIKVSEAEFDEGERKLRESYIPNHPHAKFAIVTNYEKWRFYNVEKGILKPIVSRPLGLKEARMYLENIFREILSEKWKIYPDIKNINVLFEDLGRHEGSLIRILDHVIDNPKVRPLYTAFSTIMKTLYHDLREDEIKRLYVKHTLLQMTIAAALSEALGIKTYNVLDKCRGLDLPVEIVLPYLAWWYVIYPELSGTEKADIKNVANDIAVKTALVDWKARAVEDVFRELYELLIDPETRRRIGEYYTPLWVVEETLDHVEELIGSFKNAVVLDPYCGSGTFLVTIFHRKIRNEGESVEEAFDEVIGFDLNPLAVSIARAELLIAYLREGGGLQNIRAPLIFHADSIEPYIALLAHSGAAPTGFPEFQKVRSFINKFLSENWAEIDKAVKTGSVKLKDLAVFEYWLAYALRLSLSYVERDEKDPKKCVKETLLGEFDKLEVHDPILHLFTSYIRNNIDEFSGILAELIEKYGNGVWASPIASILATTIVAKVSCDVIVTNPPWLQLTKFQTPYAEHIRGIARRLLSKIRIREQTVMLGSDLASITLYLALKHARKAVGFVMPREASFYHRTSQRAGILLTYAVIKSLENEIEVARLIDLDYDAFQHGNWPALVIVKKKVEVT